MNALHQPQFPGFPMAKKKEKSNPWGHQVAVRFVAEDLRKLDLLVDAAELAGGRLSTTGMYLQPSRSSVIIDLVRAAHAGAAGKPSTKKDPRQVDLDEAIERSKLAAGVDAIERSSKKLEQRSKTKAPRGAPKKRRAENSPKRKAQIAAANRTYRAKKKRAAKPSTKRARGSH